MEIASGIDAAQWQALDLESPDSPDWNTAIGIFEARIRQRFLEPIELLIAEDERHAPRQRHFGFAILALNCLLVETFQAFREGLTETQGESKRLSRTFLTTRPHFRGFFATEALADRFYYEFRCGVVHHAQVFGTGLLWSVGPLLSLYGERITVNRTAFYTAVAAEFEDYLTVLRDPANRDERANLRKKMDFIAAGLPGRRPGG